MDKGKKNERENIKTPILRKKWGKVILGFSFALFSLSSYQLYRNTTFIESVNNLEKGVSICFARIQQSFMAFNFKNLGSSMVLGEQFADVSQQCFSDVIAEIKSLKFKESRAILDESNILSTEVYWFYRLILDGESGNIEEEEDFYQKFSKIENQRYLINDFFHKEMSMGKDDRIFYFMLLSLSLILIFLIFMKDFFERKKFLSIVKNVNSLAEKELEKDSSVDILRFNEILKIALQNSGNHSLYELYKKHNEDILENDLEEKNSKQFEADQINLLDELNISVSSLKDAILAKRLRVSFDIPDNFQFLIDLKMLQDFFKSFLLKMVEHVDEDSQNGRLSFNVDDNFDHKNNITLIVEVDGNLIVDESRSFYEIMNEVGKDYRGFVKIEKGLDLSNNSLNLVFQNTTLISKDQASTGRDDRLYQAEV